MAIETLLNEAFNVLDSLTDKPLALPEEYRPYNPDKVA
jgi:hypothetical protein